MTDLFEIELCLPADIRIRVEHGLNAGPEPGSVHDVVLVLLPAQAIGGRFGRSLGDRYKKKAIPDRQSFRDAREQTRNEEPSQAKVG